VLALIGVSVVSFDPVILALVQESHTANGALAAASFLSLLFIVRSVAVVIVGAVADWLGLRWAFMASAFVLLAGAPIVLLLPKGRDRLRA
jgi:MFS family permease